ncbi:MAG: succinylglutamate desuccinylase/aspartoacylase family protein [Bacteroidetes bacterium]|nr:succinylglutamate desuccinylase/aspartoacylase family protein [Bacteroidota bacterium]
MIINNYEVLPGKNATLRIPVASLPSGNTVNLFAHVYRSKKPGPTMLVIGGIHGDEINGIEIVRRSVKNGMFKNLRKGSVIAIPLLNIYGFINFSRGFPDGKDVNRSFPGSKKGSLAARIAYTLTHDILPLCDFGLDFHTGGASVYNYPQVRAYRDDEESMKLAEAFNMPLVVKTGLITNSFRKAAHNKGIPIVVFEGGESLRMDEFSINEGLRGIVCVLAAKGMIKSDPPKMDTVVFETSSWLRAHRSGIFVHYKQSGDHVKKGQVLGIITDPYGGPETKVKARNNGIIFGHNNKPVINQGDALFHIGYAK